MAAAYGAAQAFQERMNSLAEAVQDAHGNMAVEEFNERQERTAAVFQQQETADNQETAVALRRRIYANQRTFYDEKAASDAEEGIGASERALRRITELQSQLRGQKSSGVRATDLEQAIAQDQESLWQNVWSYAAIAIVLSAFTLVVARRSFLQLLVSFDVIFFFLSHVRAHITLLVQRNAASRSRVYNARSLLATGNAVFGLLSSLLIFAFVTLLMGRITPVVRESALAVTAVARMFMVPMLFIGAPHTKSSVAHLCSAPQRDQIPTSHRARVDVDV